MSKRRKGHEQRKPVANGDGLSEADTKPGGKLYEEAVARGAAVAKKVSEADGPLHFDAVEAETLRVLVLGLQEQVKLCQMVNTATALALQRHRLQLVHHEHEDGTISYDLQPQPEQDEPVTVN